VLLFGATGYGKSFLASLFGEYKLNISWDEDQEQVNIDHADP